MKDTKFKQSLSILHAHGNVSLTRLAELTGEPRTTIRRRMDFCQSHAFVISDRKEYPIKFKTAPDWEEKYAAYVDELDRVRQARGSSCRAISLLERFPAVTGPAVWQSATSCQKTFLKSLLRALLCAQASAQRGAAQRRNGCPQHEEAAKNRDGRAGHHRQEPARDPCHIAHSRHHGRKL